MEWISGSFIIIGAFFIFIAGLGLVRFPDVYTRMHAVSKSMSMGIGAILIAAMLEFASWSSSLKALLIIVFLFLTIPVTSHIISIVAYFLKVPLWTGTKIDEFSKTN